MEHLLRPRPRNTGNVEEGGRLGDRELRVAWLAGVETPVRNELQTRFAESLHRVLGTLPRVMAGVLTQEVIVVEDLERQTGQQ